MTRVRKLTILSVATALTTATLALTSSAYADGEVTAGTIDTPSGEVPANHTSITFSGTGATPGATISMNIDDVDLTCDEPSVVNEAQEWSCIVVEVFGVGTHTARATATLDEIASQPAELEFTVAAAPEPIEGCATNDEGDYGGRAVTVASWNITSAPSSKQASIKKGVDWWWEDRRAGVIDMMGKCGADVFTIQEASKSTAATAGWPGSKPYTQVQYEDVLEYLNDWYLDRGLEGQYQYAFTDPRRSNCGHIGTVIVEGCSASPKQLDDPKGDYDDDADDNRILYNTRTIETVAGGDRGYANINSGGDRATAAWARFQLKDSSTRFFVATTHITNALSTKGKRKQVNKTINMIKQKNPEKLATILTGDFNHRRYDKKSAAKRPMETALKFIEISGQDFRYQGGGKYGSCIVPKANRNKYRVPYNKKARTHTWFNTTTGSSNKNHCSKSSYKHIGTALDYIFTTRNIRPRTFEIVVRPGKSQGSSYKNVYDYPPPYVTPSDHNMIVSKLKIYDSEAW